VRGVALEAEDPVGRVSARTDLPPARRTGSVWWTCRSGGVGSFVPGRGAKCRLNASRAPVALSRPLDPCAPRADRKRLSVVPERRIVVIAADGG
jgi:hypothetical protein